MKNIIHVPLPVSFDSLEPGDFFKYDSAVYMKMNDGIIDKRNGGGVNSVCVIGNGKLILKSHTHHFYTSDKVIPWNITYNTPK